MPTPTVTSVVAGQPTSGGRTTTSTNPARLSDAVATVELGSAETFVDACRAPPAQRGWAGVPAPVRGQVVAAIGRLVEENAEALASS